MRGKSKSQRNQSFLKGALILTLSVTLVKIMGFLFRIPLAHIIGTVGSGIYSSAYDIYNPIYALATAGLPIAISRMVSDSIARKKFRDVRRIHRVSVPIFLITGILGFIAMILGAFIYTEYTKTPEGIYSIFALAPTVLFACLMSIYRGYYNGLRNMVPTAISEIIEAMCRFFVGLGCAYAVVRVCMNEFYSHGTIFGKPYATEALAREAVGPYSAAGAIFGVTVGAFAGFLFLMLRHKIKGDSISKKELEESPEALDVKSTIKSLISIAIPVGLGAIIMNLGSMVDATLVRRRIIDIMSTTPIRLIDSYNGLIPNEVIQNGTTHTFLYGCFSYSSNLTALVPAITQVFAISALPAVTAAWAKGDKKVIKSSIESILKITTLVTIPAGLGLVALAHPILSMIFGGPDLQNSVRIAANILSIMGISAIFLSTSTPICSMLQAIGRVDLPVKLLVVGITIKVLLNYTLVGIPEINIQGAGVGSLACYAFVTVVALYFLFKETQIRPDLVSIFIKPLLASICCALSAYFSHKVFSMFVSSKISVLIAILIAVLVYIFALILFKAITEDDIKMMPKGEKIIKILAKRKRIG